MDACLRSPRRLLAGVSLVALAALATFVLPVASARADLIDLSACNLSPLSQPFAPWLDGASSSSRPGGDFESSSWTLQRRRCAPRGSEPFAATGDARRLVAFASGRCHGAVAAYVRRCGVSDRPLLHLRHRPRRGQRRLRRRDPSRRGDGGGRRLVALAGGGHELGPGRADLGRQRTGVAAVHDAARPRARG